MESVRSDLANTGSLAVDLSIGDKSAVILLNGSNNFALPFDNKPGVVWINGERIEYWNADVSVAGQMTISNLRRTTHGTSVNEQRSVVRTQLPVGLPYQTQFVLQGTEGKIEVVKYNTLTNRTTYVDASQYTTHINTGYTVVTLNTGTSDFYIVSLNNGLVQPAGSIVYNGTQLFSGNVPLGAAAGDRYVQPMTYIIEG